MAVAHFSISAVCSGVKEMVGRGSLEAGGTTGRSGSHGRAPVEGLPS